MMKNRQFRNLVCRFVFWPMSLVLISVLTHTSGRLHADEKPALKKEAGPAFGQRIVLSGAVTAVFERDLIALAKECQKQAIKANRDSVLVLELHRGPSKFGRVLDIARFLISQDISRVRTVAWIPEDQKVTGNNVILALACNEIVMHPDAMIGDIGEGDPADNNTQQFVRTLVERLHNSRLNWALAKGMMDPQAIVKKIKIRPKPGGILVPRIVTEKELAKLLADNVEIPDAAITFKEQGESGLFTGSKLNTEGVLVVTTRTSLEQVAALYNVPARLLRAVPVASGKDKNVALIRVDGVIDPIMETFLQRLIDRCLADGKNLIIFEIDSPGGYLSSSENLANRISNLDPKKVKTVAYIPKQAISGAAIIALGCDEIYLAPDAQIGDAGPIALNKGGQFERVPHKILSKLKATMRSLAEKKHRPAALLEAMADENLEVFKVQNRDNPDQFSYMSQIEIDAANGMWIKGAIVPESETGDLLTLTGKRAHELGLAEGVVEGTTDEERELNLKAHLGLAADMKLIPLKQTWVDSLVFFLNTRFSTVLLLVVGIVCIYLELQMTTGVLGIISALCFALFFWSRFLGGTAGWLEVTLFLLGVGCILMEIFVIPGFGVFGISGGLMLLASLVLASQTFGNLEPSRDFQLLSQTMGNLAISIMLVVFFAMTLSRYLPHVPIFNRMVLTPPAFKGAAADAGPRLRPEYLDGTMALIGEQGAAVSVLRPAGKAEIDGKFLDVVSDGPFISAGMPIEVVQVTGNRIVVRAMKSQEKD